MLADAAKVCFGTPGCAVSYGRVDHAGVSSMLLGRVDLRGEFPKRDGERACIARVRVRGGGGAGTPHDEDGRRTVVEIPHLHGMGC